MEPFHKESSDRWPVIEQAMIWTTLLTFTVAIASFVPEFAFVSTISLSDYGFVKIPMDFPGENVRVPSHMVKNSSYDVFLPSIFAAVMVSASAFLLRSCMETDNIEEI